MFDIEYFNKNSKFPSHEIILDFVIIDEKNIDKLIEEKNIDIDKLIDINDINIIIQQTKCTYDLAIKTYIDCNYDVVDAIMFIS
jgi:NACalpha-BTF3-like transcription factor